MAKDSKIEWCDHTFNPVVGCAKVSPACDSCYAEQWAKRTGQPSLWNGERRRTTPENWRQPLKWQASARRFMDEHGRRQRVFCASLSDVFDNQWEPTWRMDLYALIGMTPDLDWLLLTKRPQNIAKMMPPPRGIPFFPNVWLGCTTENQEEADRRIPHLLAVPAAVHFLSCEPLLGPIDPKFRQSDENDPYMAYDALRGHMIGPDDVGLPKVDWVIAGGESGPNARPTHPDWARGLRDQCVAAGIPYFFKQWGNWAPHLDRDKDDPDWRAPYTHMEHSDKFCFLNAAGGCGFHGERLYVMERSSKSAAGHLLDGREWREFPEAGR